MENKVKQVTQVLTGNLVKNYINTKEDMIGRVDLQIEMLVISLIFGLFNFLRKNSIHRTNISLV